MGERDCPECDCRECADCLCSFFHETERDLRSALAAARAESRDDYQRRIDAAEAAIIQVLDDVLAGGKASDAPLDISAELARVVRAIRINVVMRERAETALAAATSAREQAEGRVAELEQDQRLNGQIISKVNEAINRAGIHCALYYWEAIDQIAGERDAAVRERDERGQALAQAFLDLNAANMATNAARSDCERLARERDSAVADMEAAEQRMLGVLDGTFSVGDGTAQREIERLRAECERMRAVFEAAAKLVTRIDPPGDWACAECRPNSDMLVAGFQCYVHRIRALTATTPGGDRE